MPHTPSRLLSDFRTRFYYARARRRFRLALGRKLADNDPLRLVIGGATNVPFFGQSGTPFDGWLVTDISSLDALNREDWKKLFLPGRIERILAEHVIEHWTEAQLRRFLEIACEYISPDGFIRIAVPDGYHPERDYIEAVKPGGSGPGSDDHKVLYTYETLGKIAVEMGWKVEMVEYFDEFGNFHGNEWSVDDGFIKRSARFDPRNKERPLTYTSLIVDLKPHTPNLK